MCSTGVIRDESDVIRKKTAEEDDSTCITRDQMENRLQRHLRGTPADGLGIVDHAHFLKGARVVRHY